MRVRTNTLIAIVGFGLALSMGFCANAAVGDLLWSRTFGGKGDDGATSIIRTAEGGYVLTGFTGSFGSGGGDVWLLSLSSDGDSLWSHTYGGLNWDCAVDVIQTGDGGFLLTGRTYSFGSGEVDAWLLRTDLHGDSLWSKTFGGSKKDGANCIIETPDGGYLLAACTESYALVWQSGLLKRLQLSLRLFNRYILDLLGHSSEITFLGVLRSAWNVILRQPSCDMWILKIDASGRLLWSRTFGGIHGDCCLSATLRADGGYLLVGCTESFGAGSNDFWIVRINSQGDSLWSHTYGGKGEDLASDVLRTLDLGYLLIGRSQSTGAGGFDFYAVKINPWGDPLWSRTYGGERDEFAFCSASTEDGGYLLAGRTKSFGAGATDAWLVKLDAQGDSLWSRTFGGSREDEVRSIVQAADGSYLLTGLTSSSGAGGSDVWLMRIAGE
ncbi:MAG: hypothetical protein ABH878_07170 [bacterium]